MFRASSIAALICVPVLALAHAGATGIVKERMDGMTVLADAMKALKGQLAIKPDPAVLARAAEDIRAHAGKNMSERFPVGSTPMVSEASPAIWEDFSGFEALANRLEAQADRLDLIAAALSGDETAPETLQTVFTDIGQTCAACHKDYRIKK